MVCEVLVAMQAHPSHFPAQWGPASHPTLPGGKGGGTRQRGGFARAGKEQMDRGPHGGHLANWGGLGDLRHDTAIIEGI